jgi:hypothetical protein
MLESANSALRVSQLSILVLSEPNKDQPADGRFVAPHGAIENFEGADSVAMRNCPDQLTPYGDQPWLA